MVRRIEIVNKTRPPHSTSPFDRFAEFLTGMFAPRLLIYEKRPRWGPELKRQFLRSDTPVRSVRTLSEAGELIAAGPPSLLIMDLRAGAGECLRFISRSRERGWPVRTLSISSPATRDLEWVARELGADHFVEENIGGEQLARLCRRYLKQLTAGDVATAESPASPRTTRDHLAEET